MKSVVLCGSKRFKKEIHKFAEKLRAMGVVVYEPFLDSSGDAVWGSLTPEFEVYAALGITLEHFRKLEIGDVAFIVNIGGYVGPSTTLEIGYAAALKKPIYALSGSDEELFRKILFTEIIQTPEELVKRL